MFYNELRNRVVHDVGKVYKSKYAELFEKVNNSELVSINDYSDIVFNENFAKKVNSDCIKVMNRLLEEINSYFKNLASK